MSFSQITVMPTRNANNRLCCRPFSRGTLLLLVWSALLNATQCFVSDSIILALPDDLQFQFLCALYAVYLLLPVTGWVAESWMGRYRAIIVGFVISVIVWLMLVSVFIMLQFSWTPIPPIVLLCTTLPIAAVGVGVFYTNLLPFTLDQMIGASAEELSAAIHWYYWGFNLGLLTLSLLKCIPIWNTMFQHILPTILLTFSTLCLSAVLISDCLFHSWLDSSSSKITNPIKLIYKVLNYARKTKYPTNRSAFTYLDEEEPSRLDFGKEKFGGPFTEEEVEDVKTVLRMLPLLTVAGIYISPMANESFLLHIIPTTIQTNICVAELHKLINSFTAVLLIPAYRFILYPVFYNYIPSMIKRTVVGLFLCLVSTLITLTLDTVGHHHSNTTHCMLDTNTGSTDTFPIPIYWLLISDFVYGVGCTVLTCSTSEFVMAQTPNKMRGVMSGLGFAAMGMCVLTSQLLQLLFQQLKSATPSCGFYYFLVLSLLILLILVLFIIFSKHYKLRERERHVNIQAIAEEHYERYLDQEEEYMREVANRYQQQ